MVGIGWIPDDVEIPEDASPEQLFRDALGYDEWRLRRLVERHHHYTGSSRAADILAGWEDYLPKFVKVMPEDYREALEQRRPADTMRVIRTGESPRGG